MYFDRWDIVEAHYLYCSQYYNGMGCPLYRRLCKISKYYKPGPLFRFEGLSENAQEIYCNLVAHFMEKHS